jgi:hypothetical protein
MQMHLPTFHLAHNDGSLAGASLPRDWIAFFSFIYSDRIAFYFICRDWIAFYFVLGLFV